MYNIKRLLSCFLVAIVFIATIPITVVAASVYDTAESISNNKTITKQSDTQDEWWFKISPKAKGELIINYTYEAKFNSISVFDKNGTAIKATSWDIKSGSNNGGGVGAEYCAGIWSKNSEKFNATVKYSISKGTYYIKVTGNRLSPGTNKMTLKATFPTSTAQKGKISYLQVTIPKGSTLKLAAVISGSGTATWTSSKKSVATVSSKGLVTAKSAGTTIITAKLGSSSVKIRIKVTS